MITYIVNLWINIIKKENAFIRVVQSAIILIVHVKIQNAIVENNDERR